TVSATIAPSTSRMSAIPMRPTPPEDDPDDEPLDDDRPDEKSRLASPESVMIRINRICSTNVEKLSINPIEIAPPASTPLRWKNRTSSATRAAELGTASEMNWTPYWSIRTGM